MSEKLTGNVTGDDIVGFISGDKGDPGVGIKEIEWSPGEDKNVLHIRLTNGRDYAFDVHNGKDGYTPQKDVDYFDGKDGDTPVKDVDYFDGKDGEGMPMVTDADEGKLACVVGGKWATITIEELAEKIKALVPDGGGDAGDDTGGEGGDETVYTVNFYDDDGTFLHTVEVAPGGTAEYTPEKEGYIFDGWEPNNANITADTDCYAKWTAINVEPDVEYDYSGSITASEQTTLELNIAGLDAINNNGIYLEGGGSGDYYVVTKIENGVVYYRDSGTISSDGELDIEFIRGLQGEYVGIKLSADAQNVDLIFDGTYTWGYLKE